MDPTEFFATARERQAIYLRRQAGQPWPWTQDWVMQKYSITNVFRENDKTTKWFRTNVRDPLRSKPEVLLATVLFRWFNRITTGEAIFSQGELTSKMTAWSNFLRTGDTDWLRDSIVAFCGKGPYVTGSYIILGQQGMPKLDGVLKCLEMFYGGLFPGHMLSSNEDVARHPDLGRSMGWREVADVFLTDAGHMRLEDMWRWLRQVPYLGDFMAYEIVTDLRFTDLLDQAPDINTWANPGPGAARGLARLHGRAIEGRKIKKPPKQQMIAEMQELLALSRMPSYWPRWASKVKGWTWGNTGSGDLPGFDLPKDPALFVRDAWPAWELHEVEMWLCEYDKIMRARTGQGRPRGTYRPS